MANTAPKSKWRATLELVSSPLAALGNSAFNIRPRWAATRSIFARPRRTDDPLRERGGPPGRNKEGRPAPLSSLGNALNIRRGRPRRKDGKDPLRERGEARGRDEEGRPSPLAALGNALNTRRGRPRREYGSDTPQERGGALGRNGEEQKERGGGTVQEGGWEYFYVEEVQQNIFNQPVVVRRRMRRKMPETQPDDHSDVLAGLIARHCAERPDEVRRFVPGRATVLPNSMLEVGAMPEDLSIMTPNTCFHGCSSTGASIARQNLDRKEPDAIGEYSNETSSDSQVENAAAQVTPTQDVIESGYLESFTPDLPTLRVIVEQSIRAGAEAEAIDVVTQSLIINNAISLSEDMAFFCLTTLGDLARNENGRRIISQGATFAAIVEAEEIYREQSLEVHAVACKVLWSLSAHGPLLL